MIRRILYRVGVLLLCPGLMMAQTRVPATPAGRTLQTWLDVMSSGDRGQAEQYVKTIDPRESVDGLVSFHDQTGGFVLLGIESSELLHIRFRVREKNSSTTALGNLVVKDGNPPTVETFGLRAIPPGVTPVNVTLDAGMRAKVIAGIDEDLAKYYIDPAVAKKMQEAIDAHEKAGDYSSITDGDDEGPARGEPRPASWSELQPVQGATAARAFARGTGADAAAAGT
jgi:hypothetical protein